MKSMLLCLVVFIQLLIQPGASRKGTLAPQINLCIGKTSCGECLTGGPMCAYCTAEDYDQRNLPRCDLFGNHQGRCPGKIVFPMSSEFNVTNVEVGNAGNAKEAVQIQPQQIDIKLRPNDPQRFNVTFRLAENYPVDLYFLMDSSHSMKDYKDMLAAEAITIANTLKTMTSDVQMGLGTFVDKPVMPFASTAPGKTRPFGYKNDLELVSNFDTFKQRVENAQLFGNLDFAEGGSDAIVQALSCKNQVGWRENTRRILLFSSDADFHYAGDGKLGGITERNDGVCNIDANSRMYTKSLTQDYPSLGQIAAQIKQKDINLVFAIPEKMFQRYQKISDFIQGSDVGQISNGSSNLVSLIQDVYRRLISKVTLLHSEVEDVSVKFYTNCNNRGSKENKNTCENVNLGESITFEVEIELKSCPSDPAQYNKTIQISPLGLSDRTTVNLNYICQCDCEKPSVSVPNSPNCTSKGTEVCGTCKCNEGYFGKKCECDKTTKSQLEERCKNPDTQEICSGQGLCSCGTCECFTRTATSEEKYSGQYCQCDDYSCPFHLGQICGGVNHGTCKCGNCNCTKDYTGASCDCPTRTDTCMARGNKPGGLCNGHGNCVCGKCQCNKNYRGSTCEDCPECNEVCRQYKPCVQCVVHKSGSYNQTECQSKCMTEGLMEEVDKLQEGADFKTCEFKDASDCRFYFNYKYVNNDELKIQARKGLDCPEEVNVVAIVLGVVLPIVIIGIIAIVAWKVATTVYDSRQLARFQKEVQASTWREENPTYKDPVRHYKNPTYKGNQK